MSDVSPKDARLRGHRSLTCPPIPHHRIIRFSTFEVNLHTGELRQRGQKVKLQEQPLQVLAALLERPGELVTREELRSKLWPADTFVDFDHSLNAAIKRLRDALGESADARSSLRRWLDAGIASSLRLSAPQPRAQLRSSYPDRGESFSLARSDSPPLSSRWS